MIAAYTPNECNANTRQEWKGVTRVTDESGPITHRGDLGFTSQKAIVLKVVGDVGALENHLQTISISFQNLHRRANDE
jgi:hypothetical protein